MTTEDPARASLAAQASTPAAASAGQLLRAAREAKGLHIAALAAALKVTPRKLELLEGDRHAELNDLTFARVLAQAVCRHLKVDAAPVLALLPQSRSAALGRVVEGGLNARFENSSAHGPLMSGGGAGPNAALQGLLRRPLVLAALLLLLAAPLVWFWPDLGLSAPAPAAAPQVTAGAALEAAPSAAAPAASDAAAAAAAAAASAAAVLPLQETVHSAPLLASEVGAAVASAPVSQAMLLISVVEASWVEVLDGANQPLLSRAVLPGESVGLNGVTPLRLKVGNAAATRLLFKGQNVDLAPLTRDNVARLELK